MKNLLYHYTSLDALKGMFESYDSNNNFLTFWATNCAYMNDPLEIKEGIHVVIKALDSFECPIIKDKIKEILSDPKFFEFLLYAGTKTNKIGIPYAISLSSVPDDINMWNMYGDKGKGVMLGFNSELLHENFKDIINCIYNEKSKEEKIMDDVNSAFNKSFSEFMLRYKDIKLMYYLAIFISQYASYIKNNIYNYESETRLTVTTNTPKFRVLRNVLTPYTEIKIPIQALECIKIGPDCDNRNIQSIRLLVFSKGLDILYDNITQSLLPYRN